MGRPLKIKKSTTSDIGFNAWDQLTNPVYNDTFNPDQFLGVVGGNDSAGTLATAAYPVVKCRVFITGFSEADGYIIRQKGSTKYLVTDGTNTGVCTLANEADTTLTAGNMNITFSFSDSSATLISKLTNKFMLDYSSPPVRYATNFFTDEGQQIKSGTSGQANTATQQNLLDVGIVENYT
jgi:hypothetical protein